jgi:hypothetical protein
LAAFVIVFFQSPTRISVRPFNGDETGIDYEVVIDAADGLKTRLNLPQCFPDVRSILVAFDHYERTQRHPYYPGFFDLVVSKARCRE